MFLFPVTIFLNIIREMLNTNVILNLGNGKFGIVPIKYFDVVYDEIIEEFRRERKRYEGSLATCNLVSL